MHQNPSRVAILMPAYNAGRSIDRAVASLMQSTLSCDVFIVDDGSRIPVADELDSFPRTTVLRLPRNVGIPRARNAGLAEILARGYEFVGCLDADDICHPERLAEQVAYLDAHPNVAVIGAWGRYFDEQSGETLYFNYPPTKPAAVRKAMLFNSAVINSSAMFRASALQAVGLYSTQFPAAEDYELYRRIARRYDIASIPRVLIDISVSSTGISLSRRRRQLADRLMIQWKYFEPLRGGAWLGIAKTLALFAAPVGVLNWIKSKRRETVADGADGVLRKETAGRGA